MSSRHGRLANEEKRLKMAFNKRDHVKVRMERRPYMILQVASGGVNLEAGVALVEAVGTT